MSSSIALQDYEDPSGRLVAEVICPNCWHRFPPEQLLFIARHGTLIGDDIAGPMAYRRLAESNPKRNAGRVRKGQGRGEPVS